MPTNETASFTDPVFLAHFGLSRINVLEYFLLPLNPFLKTPNCNEVLHMQNTSIGLLMQYGVGLRIGPMTLSQAEEEYNAALSRLTGDQYELMPPAPTVDLNAGSNANSNLGNSASTLQQAQQLSSPLFTIRHVVRSSPTKASICGIYYVLEGVIYKAPSMRATMKANIARTCQGLEDACYTLSNCARYEPSTGYIWDFESIINPSSNKSTNSTKLKSRTRTSTTSTFQHDDDYDSFNEEDEEDILKQMQKNRRKRMRRIVDNRRPEERSHKEEEGIKAKEKINAILLRLNKSSR